MSFDSPRNLLRRIIDTRHEAGRQNRRERSSSFLRQHARECSNFDRLSLRQKREFLRSLDSRIADERNLQEAVIHLTSHGDKAAGPNGQRLTTLYREERTLILGELKALKRQSEARTYQPSPPRTITIPKSSGVGTRTISVLNWQDQVVQRAVVQILQPLLDTHFDDLSLGYRPGRDRTEALARAIAISEWEERYVWVVSDLKNAFDNVNHEYLLSTLEKDHWLDGLVPLIRRIIGNTGTVGIPQGGALSPFLLNVVLNKAIDRRWKRIHPDVPLIRVADDICLLCRNPEEANAAWNDLRSMAADIGMRVKGTSTTDCHNLTAGQRACWLGIEVRKEGPGIQLGLSPKFREKLKNHLVEQISQPDSLLAVGAMLRGTFDQLGPLAGDGLTAALQETAKVLVQLQMESPASPEELRTIWEKARTRYLARQKYYRLVSSSHGTSSQDASRGEGFAPRHRTRPETPVDARATAVAEATVELVTASLSNGMGAWLCAIDDQQTQAPNIQCQSVGRVTATRLSLLGLLSALDNTTTQRVIVRTDSSYLCNLRLAYQRLGEAGREAEPRSSRHPNQDLLVTLRRKLQSSARTLDFQFRPIPRGTSRANTARLVPAR